MSEQVFTNCNYCGPYLVYVDNGKIVRLRPLNFTDGDALPWSIEARGHKFTPPRRIALAPFGLVERQRAYAKDRVLYPRKRVDFDPNGDRHTENRGKSTYERISWDEALNIVSGEMKRIREQYGPAAITAITSSHHNAGNINFRQSAFRRFFNLIGYTEIYDNPDSWEGWHWGATHAYGYYWKLGMPEQHDLLEDALKHTDLIVNWSNDPDTNRSIHTYDSALYRVWLKQVGIKQIFIDPYCNYTAVTCADKWIAPRPGTDAAMAEAIAYVWIKENTYDKDYVSKRTLGFEDFKKHILGDDDGLARSPGWAAEICGVPARDIVALAREWASKRTMLGCGTRGGMGGANRQAYAHEWARLMVLLQAMQGLGKPGVNIWATTQGAPYDGSFHFPGYAEGGIDLLAKNKPVNPVKQKLYRLLFPEAILSPPIHWLGEGFCGKSLEQQFIPKTYPLPGNPEIKMFYRYGGSFIGTMTETNRWVKAYQSPKLEFIANQSIWMDPETRMADVILPACTNLERNDIFEIGNCGGFSHNAPVCNYRLIVYLKKSIKPLGESRADYDIFSAIAEKLGVKEDYTEGKTIEDWIKLMFEYSSLPEHISFEDFKEKGYFVVPIAKNYKSTPAMRWFHEGSGCETPDNNPKKGTAKSNELGTFSGKIEFVSQSLKELSPDDTERPPLPRYIPSWEGHTSELAAKYPLQLISPHVRFSYHTHHDAHCPWLWEIPAHRILKDGYPYHTTRIHPTDAMARGIKDGDIIKIFNDRGAVLGIAQVTERIKPGVIHSYQASGIYDPLEPGKAYSVDRGGCVNNLTPARFISKNVPGQASNSCLVEISKWEV